MNKKNIFNLLILLLAFSCASQVKKTSLDNISNKDFEQQKTLSYNKSLDFIRSDKGTQSAMYDESFYHYRIENRDIEDTSELFKISNLCYEGKAQKAFSLIKVNQHAYRKNPIFWNQVGICYLLQKDKRKAILFLNKSLEVYSGYSPALNNLGVLYRFFNEDEKAILAFEKAVKMNNFAKTPRFNLSVLYLSYGLYNLAIPHLEVLLSVSSKDQDVLAAMGSAYLMKNNSKKALSFFKEIPSDKYEKPSIGINAALAHHLEGKSDRARDIFDDIDLDSERYDKNYYALVKKRLKQ